MSLFKVGEIAKVKYPDDYKEEHVRITEIYKGNEFWCTIYYADYLESGEMYSGDFVDNELEKIPDEMQVILSL